MRYFASIGTDLVCNGVQISENAVIGDHSIEVTAQVESGTALDDFTWRKYENGAWSTGKFEPVPVPYVDPLTTQVTELKSQNADIIFALVSNNLM